MHCKKQHARYYKQIIVDREPWFRTHDIDVCVGNARPHNDIRDDIIMIIVIIVIIIIIIIVT